MAKTEMIVSKNCFSEIVLEKYKTAKKFGEKLMDVIIKIIKDEEFQKEINGFVENIDFNNIKRYLNDDLKSRLLKEAEENNMIDEKFIRKTNNNNFDKLI